MVARSTTIVEDRTTSGSHKRSIVRSIVASEIDRTINSVGRRMGSDLNPRNISTFYSVSEQPICGTTDRKVARQVARLIVRPLTIWNSRFQVLNMTLLRLICPLRSPTTSATSRTTSETSRTIVLRLAHHSNIFRSQVRRNLVVSPV